MDRNRATPEEVKQHPWMKKFTKNWYPYLSEVSRQKRRTRRVLDQRIVKYDVKRLFEVKLQLTKDDIKLIDEPKEGEDPKKEEDFYVDPDTDARLKVIDDKLNSSDGELPWTIGNYVYLQPDMIHVRFLRNHFPDF